MNKWILIAATAAATLNAQEQVRHLEVVTATQGDTMTMPATAMPGMPMMGGSIGFASADAKFISFEMSMNGKTVAGAPYSADAVTETTQTLGDGNHITRKTSAKTYRDSQGRTRREQSFQAIGDFSAGAEPPAIVQINDPVAGVNYSLNAAVKEAMKFENPSEQMHQQTAFRVQKQIAEAKANGAKVSTFTTSTTQSSQVKEESLGSQMVNGVQAEGTRNTITIPAGQIGNELPINIVDERWFSSELQTLVKSIHDDPRMGITTYQLTNINRGEPAASLFEVPADYKVNTMPAGMPGDKIQTERIMIKRSQE
jgi:hypothetical protein